MHLHRHGHSHWWAISTLPTAPGDHGPAQLMPLPPLPPPHEPHRALPQARATQTRTVKRKALPLNAPAQALRPISALTRSKCPDRERPRLLAPPGHTGWRNPCTDAERRIRSWSSASSATCFRYPVTATTAMGSTSWWGSILRPRILFDHINSKASAICIAIKMKNPEIRVVKDARWDISQEQIHGAERRFNHLFLSGRRDREDQPPISRSRWHHLVKPIVHWDLRP